MKKLQQKNSAKANLIVSLSKHVSKMAALCWQVWMLEWYP